MSERNVKAELASICLQLSWNGGRPQPLLLIGVPGTGKTQFLEGLATRMEEILRRQGRLKEDEKFEFASWVLPQTTPDKLEGAGVPDKERTTIKYLPLADMKRISEAKFGLCFGDELSSGSDETGAAFMAFAQDGRAGDIRVHNEIARAFAMNHPDHAAAGRCLSMPEANRFLHLEDWTIPRADFLDYLRGGPGFMAHVRELPMDWEEQHGMLVRFKIAEFLATNPQLINEIAKEDLELISHVDPEEHEVTEHGAYATQRSWVNAGRLVAAIRSLNEPWDSPLIGEALKGIVGKYCGTQFWEYLQEQQVPTAHELVELYKTQGLDEVLKFLRSLRTDYRKAGLEALAQHSAGKDHIKKFGKPKAIEMYELAWAIVEPVLRDRRDDAMSAASHLVKWVPGMDVPPAACEYFHQILSDVVSNE